MIQGSSRWEVGNGMRGAALAGQVAEAVGWLVGWLVGGGMLGQKGQVYNRKTVSIFKKQATKERGVKNLRTVEAENKNGCGR